MWLSGAIHGDELNGIAIIKRVLRRIDPGELAGTVIAVPVVNMFGLLLQSRYMPDRRDLNRCFPGSARGPLASQLAHLFMTEIAARCSLGIDLHTGSDGRTNHPHIRCDTDDPETRAAAEAFGAPVMLNSSMRAGTMRAAAFRVGARVLVYEAGEALRFDKASIDAGVAGILRVLRHLNMGGFDVPEPQAPSVIAQDSHWLRAGASGLCDVFVELGDRVDKGDRIAVISDTSGRDLNRVRARESGIVIGHVNHALVYRGDAIAHVATTSKRGDRP